jgi:hypothetical protein
MSLAQISTVPTPGSAPSPCAAPRGATGRPAASASAAATKPNQPNKSRTGPTAIVEKPNRTGNGRRVNQDGTLQKGAEGSAKSANRFGALVEMELDILDDLDQLNQTDGKDPDRKNAINKS